MYIMFETPIKSIREKNRFWSYSSYLLVECYNRDLSISGYFLVDTNFQNLVSSHKWHIGTQGYPCTRVDDKIRKIHQLILNSNAKSVIDHINQDKLDNRLSNLRFTNKKVNAINSKLRIDNTSGCKGVAWHKKAAKWRAYIAVGKGQKHLGLFESFDQAMFARYEAELEYF